MNTCSPSRDMVGLRSIDSNTGARSGNDSTLMLFSELASDIANITADTWLCRFR